MTTSGPGGPGYRVEVLPDWPAAARAAAEAGLAAPTPFQGRRWLHAWYATLGRAVAGTVAGGTPLPVLAREAAAPGRGALLLPLVLRVDDATGRRVVEFADRGVTDYNAPLLGPGSPDGGDDAPRRDRELWRAVRAALPPADLALLARMLPEIDGRPNPLARLPGATPSTIAGHVLTVESDDFPAWRRAGLAKPARKELERSWRVFLRYPDAAFRRVTDSAEAMEVIFRRPGGGVTPLGGAEVTGGHKGYGLGVMVQVLSATLTGAAFGPIRDRARAPGQPDDVGHFFLAIDPRAFRPAGGFQDDMDAMLDVLRASPAADPARPVLVPGDPEAAERAKRLEVGIPVPPTLDQHVRDICARSGASYVLSDK